MNHPSRPSVSHTKTRRAAVARTVTLIGAVALIGLGWLLVAEPDVARIPVRTVADLERELEALSLSATAGLVASEPDVARFSIALDDGRLLTERTKQRAWTAPSGANGAPLPYALGWFVQQYQSRRVVWHYGHALESSSLIVKVPEERVTFVVLANSDGLSRWRSLGDDADLTASPAAMLLLNWQVAQQGR